MADWKEYKLRDFLLIPIRNGLTKPSAIRGQGVKMIGMKEIFAMDYIRSVEMDRVPVTNKEYESSEIMKYDLLFARQSLTLEGAGKCSIVVSVNEPTVFESHLIRLRIDTKKANPFFIYYYYKSSIGKNQIKSLVQQVAAAGIRGKELIELGIKVPHIEKQNQIASILKSLDDKIEVNRKINENLEQQAQTLFKYWFVDFEPFKNGDFVESELGMIPKGWRVGQIKDICKFENGFAFKSDTYTTNGVYKVVTIKNVQDGYLDTEGANLISDIPNRMPDFCRLNTGEVLLSLTGNVGRCSFVNEDNLLLNQRVAKIKPHVESDLGYIYTLFRMPDFKERLISIARGTAQANLSPIETSKLSIVIPPTEIMKRYSVLSTYTYKKIICCMKESRLLAELRDTLLPKLMSGELKVNEIEDVL